MSSIFADTRAASHLMVVMAMAKATVTRNNQTINQSRRMEQRCCYNGDDDRAVVATATTAATGAGAAELLLHRCRGTNSIAVASALRPRWIHLGSIAVDCGVVRFVSVVLFLVDSVLLVFVGDTSNSANYASLRVQNSACCGRSHCLVVTLK